MPAIEIDIRDLEFIRETLEESLKYMRENKTTNSSKESRNLFSSLIKSVSRIDATVKHGPH